MLAAEGNKVVDGRHVAAFDVATEELAALGESEGVDCWGCAEDAVGGELGADGVDLLTDVAEEGGLTITGGSV